MSVAETSLLPPTDLRERLAQLLMVRIGSNLPPIRRVHEDEQRVAELLKECPVGGLLLFNGVWPETRATLQRLQAISPQRLLVASDIERGAGQQVAGLTVFPHQRAFVDLPDAEAAVAEFCRTTATEAHAAGIDIIFGPVADVNSDPRNPIIATRAFGDDTVRAAELVAAYVQSCEAAGLMATAKHFPGHGDTHQDSHDAMPRVEASLETLHRRELVPFQAAIDAGVSLLMTAHVEYPALDASGTPATLSRPILVDLLRGEMGFKGVVCSDSLLMAGVRDRFDSEGALCLAALNAGVDFLLDVADPAGVVVALMAAIDDGRLTIERVDEAFDRVWGLKGRAASRPEVVEPTADDLAATEAVSEKIASAATRVVSAAPGALPLDPTKNLTCLVLKPHHRPTDPSEQPLAAALRGRFAAIRYFETGPEVDTTLAADILSGVPADAPLLVAMIVKPAAWHAFGLAPEQDRLIRQLLEARPVVVACLGVENALEGYPNAAVRLVTHSDVPSSQRALAAALVKA
ncbi:putative lipoprotein YbbD precursor [Botrimarina colliarenosi]|uniref:beta-N-acetylhexosaminidase n=1 Tax=Botrimarina colliarenosi TaxID=2528001 RepID=A0A5C6ACV9_9BACT|nr:glycoside hydrolase family 3 N-terminal domain-containing protein [Botrimarina colliarenosi]TWT97804.1 putative lipoprotein YbbD precursor [Botrimarina colliarenosi]